MEPAQVVDLRCPFHVESRPRAVGPIRSIHFLIDQVRRLLLEKGTQSMELELVT